MKQTTKKLIVRILCISLAALMVIGIASAGIAALVG